MGLKTQSGVTLVELLTVITIVAIILSIGVPSYKYVTNSSRATAEVNSLFGDIQLARSEAIKQGLQVTVCESEDGATCAGNDTWQKGWVVMVDPNNDQATGITILKVQKALQTAFGGQDTFNGAGVSLLAFNREGFGQLGADAWITLHDPNSQDSFTRCLYLQNPIAKMSVVKYDGTNCK